MRPRLYRNRFRRAVSADSGVPSVEEVERRPTFANRQADRRFLFYRADKDHPEDGETVIDGLECKVWYTGKARHAPARPLSARGRARSSSGFVPIGDVVAGVELLDGRALTPAAPQALHHVVEFGQVGGQGRVIEPEAGEPGVEVAEGAGVGPAGVGADRRGD